MNRSSFKARGGQNYGWTQFPSRGEQRNYRSTGRHYGMATEKTVLSLKNYEKNANTHVDHKASYPGKILLELKNKEFPKIPNTNLAAKAFMEVNTEAKNPIKSTNEKIDSANDKKLQEENVFLPATPKKTLSRELNSGKVLLSRRQRQAAQVFSFDKRPSEEILQLVDKVASAIQYDLNAGAINDQDENNHRPLYQRRGRIVPPLVNLTPTREPNPYAFLGAPRAPLIKCSFNLGTCGSPWSIAKDVAEFALKTPETPNVFGYAGLAFGNQPSMNFAPCHK